MSLRDKITVQNMNFKTQNNFSPISKQNIFQFHFNILFNSKSISKITFQKFFLIHFKNQIKMSESVKLSYVWDHTIKKILNYDIKSRMGIKIKEWVILNKLEDFNSLLNYTDDDFTPTGNLCYINENGEMLPMTTLQGCRVLI